MNDQVRMRVRNGSQNVEKQAQATGYIEPRTVTIPIDAFALDADELAVIVAAG